LQVLVDEGMPVQLLGGLRLNRGHLFDHINELRWRDGWTSHSSEMPPDAPTSETLRSHQPAQSSSRPWSLRRRRRGRRVPNSQFDVLVIEHARELLALLARDGAASLFDHRDDLV
jgi:hypothetical protein